MVRILVSVRFLLFPLSNSDLCYETQNSQKKKSNRGMYTLYIHSKTILMLCIESYMRHTKIFCFSVSAHSENHFQNQTISLFPSSDLFCQLLTLFACSVLLLHLSSFSDTHFFFFIRLLYPCKSMLLSEFFIRIFYSTWVEAPINWKWLDWIYTK